MADIQNLAALTEEDIKFRYITPSIESAGWQKDHIYQENAYRVLLTRARQGMTICVPEGFPEGATRLQSTITICRV